MDKLPTDVILLIFSKLPIKTLLGLKCVCKSWSRIINGQDLAELHLNEGVEQPRILHLLPKSDCTSGKPNISWEEDGNIMQIGSKLFTGTTRRPNAYVLESSCNGILCFKKKYGVDRTAYLLNPFKQEALELPAPNSLSQLGLIVSYGLGFDGASRGYKIVRIVSWRCKTQDEIQCCFKTTSEIYTLGTSSSWRALNSSLPCPVFGRSVFASGILYWVGLTQLMNRNYPEDNDINNTKIVAFDVAKEEFRLISFTGQFLLYHLVDLGGVLGIVDCSSRSHIEIWTLRDYDRESWVKEYKFEICAPSFLICTNFNGVEVIGLWKEGELLLKSGHSLISYNPRNDTFKYIHIPSGNLDTEICSFTGSLVSPSSFKPS